MHLVPRSVRRVLMLAALALTALSGAGATAEAAITVANPGTLTATDSGNLQFRGTLHGFPVTLSCTTYNLTLSVTSSGAVSGSAASTSGCTDGLGGNALVAPTVNWTGQIKGSTGAYRWDSLTWDLLVKVSFGTTCNYASGSVTSVSLGSPVSTMPFSNAGPLASTSPSTCGNLSVTGTLNLSKSLSISGSL